MQVNIGDNLNKKIENSANADSVTHVLNEYGVLDKLSPEDIFSLKYINANNIRDMLDILIEGDMLDTVYTDSSILHLSAAQAKTRVNFALANGIKLTAMDLRMSSKDFEEKYGISDRDLYTNHAVTYGMDCLAENNYAAKAREGVNEAKESEYEAAGRLIDGNLGKYSQDGCVLKIGEYNYSLPKTKRNLGRIIVNMSSKDLANLDSHSAEDIIVAALLTNRAIKPEQVETLRGKLFEEREKKGEMLSI